FESIGHKCVSVHNLQLNTFSRQNDFLTDPKLTAVFVGGGETFCLLDEIRRNNMDDTLAHRVKNGLKYIGSSAGSVLAGPTIMTTNDNPIAFPRGTRTKEFNALNIINFQIKPHYWHGKLREDYNGETQEQRIKKYHVRNSYPVVALPEGSFLRVEGENVMLKGDMAARYFEKGAEPEVWPVNTVRFFPSFEKRG
ncbi:MAG TPA: Type 1 glutamine amidotransferase-like domain-containing protein, partial [Patescibacteria group bacterium]|nr:Type 1 glutamine amidotransferase-like domain-containing protein [Patescibacteria group bacterium]